MDDLWVRDLQMARDRLLRVLRVLLADLGAGRDTKESQTQAWAAIRDLESQANLAEPPTSAEPPDIMVREMNVPHPETMRGFLRTHLEGGGDGALECLQETDTRIIDALAYLLEALCNKGILVSRDVQKFARSYPVVLSRGETT